MNSKVTFYGASDDLIEVLGTVPGCDEYATDDATFLIIGGDRRCYVRVRFESNGCWSVALWPAEEGVPMPAAAITLRGDTPYSAQAVFDGIDHVARVSAGRDD